GDRAIAIEPFPMGIDAQKFSDLSKHETVKEHIRSLKEHYKDQKIFLSIDRLDYSKGIIQRLEAFELFLQENPDYHEKVVLFMIVVTSRDNVEEYQRLKSEIERIVSNINSHDRSLDCYPIAYGYRCYPFLLLSALYNIADVCLLPAMRDG